MDCLFTDKEKEQLDIYMDELQTQCTKMILYMSPDFNIAPFLPIPICGYVPVKEIKGAYKGAQLCVFDGLDSHTCCLMPDPKYSKGGIT